VQNASAPPPANSISIAFQPTPAGSVLTSGTVALTAVVSNDSANAGVDWALTCQSAGNCGSLSSLHTNSGQAVTYTPPPSLSSNSQAVKIVAFATSDHTKNVIAPITVTGFASGLKGTFVLQASGVDLSGRYQFAGVIVLDGNGGITSGEQTVNYIDQISGAPVSASDPITSGNYSIGSDGRGTLTINTPNQNIGQRGVEAFYLVLLSSSQALITKVDDLTAVQTSANETASGTMDLQTSTAPPISGYAFVASGTDSFLSPMALGGVFNIDSPRTISGANSVADQDLAGSVFLSAALSGTVSDPDAFGMVKLDLTTDFASVPVHFTGYIVDNLHIKLIESDNSTPGSGFGSTSGMAIGQGTATGTFTSNQSFYGNYVFGISGTDLNSGLASSLASAGVFTVDGTGNLTSGFNDEFLAGLILQISDQFTGTYLVETTGRVDTGSSINFVNNGPGPEFIFYLTGNENPPLMLDFDTTLGSVGVGMAHPATPNSTFAGEYGINFIQNNSGSENDATGEVNVDGTAQTLSGMVDTNFVFTPLPDTAIAGSFVTTNVPERLTGILSNQLFPADLAVAYYLIDSVHALFIETDSGTNGNLTFGYFARRTSICPGCP
jgi:hypothetical protein